MSDVPVKKSEEKYTSQYLQESTKMKLILVLTALQSLAGLVSGVSFTNGERTAATGYR
jgi:hypothetical protein